MSEANTTTTTTAADEKPFEFTIGKVTVEATAKERTHKGKKSATITFNAKTFADVTTLLEALATVEGHSEASVVDWLNREAFNPLGKSIAETGMTATESPIFQVDEKGQVIIGEDGKPLAVLDEKGQPKKAVEYELDIDKASGAIAEELQPASRRAGGEKEKELRAKWEEVTRELLPILRAQISGKATEEDINRVTVLTLEVNTIEEKLEKLAKDKADRAQKKADRAKAAAAAPKK